MLYLTRLLVILFNAYDSLLQLTSITGKTQIDTYIFFKIKFKFNNLRLKWNVFLIQCCTTEWKRFLLFRAEWWVYCFHFWPLIHFTLLLWSILFPSPRFLIFYLMLMFPLLTNYWMELLMCSGNQTSLGWIALHLQHTLSKSWNPYNISFKYGMHLRNWGRSKIF